MTVLVSCSYFSSKQGQFPAYVIFCRFLDRFMYKNPKKNPKGNFEICYHFLILCFCFFINGSCCLYSMSIVETGRIACLRIKKNQDLPNTSLINFIHLQMILFIFDLFFHQSSVSTYLPAI